MKRHPISVLQLLVTVMLSLFFATCDKEHCTHTYTLYKPIIKTLSEVRANMKSNPAQTLKNPGKIYIYGNYIFLNESNEGIHIIDNSQPSAPKNIAFINIPGNLDLAVTGSTLYADSYGDLVAFDVSNPISVQPKKFLSNVFPYRAIYGTYSNGGTTNPDSIKVVCRWETRDTTVDCDSYNRLYTTYYSAAAADASGSYASPQLGNAGKGGSMARFTLMNDYLYTVSTRELSTFNITTPQDPKFVTKTFVDNQTIETIYPFRDKLFIGSTAGMYIYDVSSAGNPVKQGQFTHARSCDPVIVDGNTAWVTLRNGTICGGTVNQLEAVNVTDVTKPSLVKTYSFSNPFGLSKEGNVLFVCDGKEGLKIYDATNAEAIKLIKHITGLETYDVITWNYRALVVAKDGLYQFDYSDLNNIRLLSKIGL
jgi:hypothetical protein